MPFQPFPEQPSVHALGFKADEAVSKPISGEQSGCCCTFPSRPNLTGTEELVPLEARA